MPAVWSTYFATADVDATARKAAEAGAQLFMPPFDVLDVGRMAFAADPTGAAFGLWQAKTHHGVAIYDEPGCVTWNELHTRDYAGAQAFYTRLFSYTYDEIGRTTKVETDHAAMTIMVPMMIQNTTGPMRTCRPAWISA